MSDRTLEHDLHKNVQPWPQDWDWHIIKSANLFLDAKGIPPINVLQSHTKFFARFKEQALDVDALTYGEMRDNILDDSTDLRMVIEVDEGYIYICLFAKNGHQSVIGKLFRVSGQIDDVNEADENVLVIEMTEGYAVAIFVGEVTGTNGFAVIEELDTLLKKDYWNNEGGDDEEDEPTPEFDPVDSFDLKPSLAS